MVNNSFATPDIVIFEINLMSMFWVRLGFSFLNRRAKKQGQLEKRSFDKLALA